MSSCASTSKNCGLFERSSSEYRLCRAEGGSKEYQFRVGMEKYVYKDFRDAKRWFHKAASDKMKKYSALGLMPNTDTGLAETNTHYTEEVSEEGNEAAAYMLATMYRDGVGVSVNKKTADGYASKAGKWVVVVDETPDHFLIHIKTRTNKPDQAQELYELYAFKVLRSKGLS